ncbi:MAG: hypothetical protein RLZZ283_479, partial [Candidatus Parcubacteria bacterium]
LWLEPAADTWKSLTVHHGFKIAVEMNPIALV